MKLWNYGGTGRTDGFYHSEDFAMCQESIQAAFGRTPDNIIVTFSLTRPHRKGWVQIRYNGKFIIKRQQFSRLCCQIQRWPIGQDCVWMKLDSPRPYADTLAQESAMRLCEIIGQKGYGGSHSFILTA